MSRIASEIKVTHFTRQPLQHDTKKALTLCGYSLPVREITNNERNVTCFLCFTSLEREHKNADENASLDWR